MSTTLQPLIDATAWDLLNRRTPYLARAIYEYLQAGRSPVDVLHEIRSSCTDRSLLPLLACAIHGCASGASSSSRSNSAMPGPGKSILSRLSNASRQAHSLDAASIGDAAVVLPSRPRGLGSDGLEEIRGAISRRKVRSQRRRFLVH
jgi:hypothetical protein